MVIVAGVPKRAIHPLKQASATVSAQISTIGMASAQRVKRSTLVSKYLKPSAYGRGPTISMCTWSKLKSLCRKGYLAISIFMPTNLVFIKGLVALYAMDDLIHVDLRKQFFEIFL